MSSVIPAATVCQPDRDLPQIKNAESGRTWLTRARTFVTAISQVDTGHVLSRDNNPDEYMLILPDGLLATIHAAGETRQIDGQGDTLVIVPPGDSRIELHASGWATRIFSHRAADLMALASNADTYPALAPDEPPAPPPGGFRLRVYRLDDYKRSDGPARPFRSTNMLINAFVPRDFRRDVRKMSPHAHEDFDQASLALQGGFVHHLRYPWTPDMTTWRNDEHLVVGSPSVIIMPAQAIHTSQDVGGGWVQLIDIFSPPRPDFVEKPGWLCNETDYPS
jgi:hypothetical protein